MNTVKITVILQPYAPWLADLLTAEMASLGYDTFIETEEGFEAFILENLFDEDAVAQLTGSRDGDFFISWHKETIAAQNWNEVWEKNYFKPLVVSNQVVVRAPFHTEFPHYPLEIVIEPKMAFGTGNHETTSLVMEILLSMDFSQRKVLDMGCGTGILAILASKRGAREITAIDNDPWSFQATSENILLNQTPNVKPLLGNATLLGEEKFDIILANIQKNVILNDLPAYASVLEPGGVLITSGFFHTDLPEIQAKAANEGFSLKEVRENNQWVASLFTLPGP